MTAPLISLLWVWLPGSCPSPTSHSWVTLGIFLNLSVPLQRETNNNSTYLRRWRGGLTKQLQVKHLNGPLCTVSTQQMLTGILTLISAKRTSCPCRAGWPRSSLPGPTCREALTPLLRGGLEICIFTRTTHPSKSTAVPQKPQLFYLLFPFSRPR